MPYEVLIPLSSCLMAADRTEWERGAQVWQGPARPSSSQALSP